MAPFILLANASAFEVGVNQLREHLFPLAFILVVLGIWESVWKSGSDPRSLLGIFIKTTIIIVLLAGFPALMKNGKEAFDGLKNIVGPDPQNSFKELISNSLPAVSVWELGPYIASLVTTVLQYLGSVGVKIVKFSGCLKKTVGKNWFRQISKGMVKSNFTSISGTKRITPF